MKTCPVCKAQCFDDMAICFGCMYHFPEDTQKEESSQVIEQDQEDMAEQFPEEPPAAVISQVEAFEPDLPAQADKNAMPFDKEGKYVVGACEPDSENTAQTIVLPLEERGLEISIIVRPLGKGA